MLLVSSTAAFGQEHKPVQDTIINNGIGLGGAMAVTISWSRNQSVLGAILHGLLSWLYGIYYCFYRESKPT
ncbi:MAG: hypothetical protein ICV83_20620 [Cytophagales bacterium]|nr:hypothetical protein [Cytophagales bacterium]